MPHRHTSTNHTKRSRILRWPFRGVSIPSKRKQRAITNQLHVWLFGDIILSRRQFTTKPAQRTKRYPQWVWRVSVGKRWLGKEVAITQLKPKRLQPATSPKLQAVVLSGYLMCCLAAIGYLIMITNNVVTPQPVWAFSLSKIEKPIPKKASPKPHKQTYRLIAPILPAVMNRSVPTHVTIESVGINADLSAVGLKTDGTLQVPNDPRQAGWYSASPTPGERGPAIIDGHVDNYIIGPAVFWRLGQVQTGDVVTVTRADGSVARFGVTNVATYSQEQGIPNSVYDNTDTASIRLITCSGVFNETTHHYSNNTVVYGELL